jgi:arginase
VEFIGAPFAEGQNLRGTELAPLALRDAGLKGMVERLGWTFLDHGDLAIPEALVRNKWKAHTTEKYRQWVRSGTTQGYSNYTGEIIRDEGDVHVSGEREEGDPYETVQNGELIGRACGLVHEAVYTASSQGSFAMTIGGDHSIASATIGALVKTYPNLAVVWVDAHADANTPETSPSNHYHGMPAAHVMGWFKKVVKGFEWLQTVLPEARLAYIGLRDIDEEEGKMLQNSGANVFTMQDVDRHGISQVMAMALNKIDPYNNRPLHLTLDIDGIDPISAPGTGTLARGGLSYRESHYICEEMASTNRLVGCDLVEVNPLVDHLPETMHGDDPEMGPASSTVQLCCELALSCLGKTILQRPKVQAVTR